MTVELTLDGFEDAVPVGWGGFAIVYRARQAGLNLEVAIKVLNVRPGTDVAEAFAGECAAIGSLSGHPNIVTVHGTGETPDGRPFIVMEYLHGGSLADVVRLRGPLPWVEAATMGVRLAGALETAHATGLLHRDVKPENVLVSRFGEPKLGDFGIARLRDGTILSSGGLAGSLRHLAPELLHGGIPTVASDVYSLGSTLFTLLAGRPPFESGEGDGTDLRAQIASEPVPDLRPQGVPDPVCDVVEQALAKEPQARQPSAQEVGRQLQDALAAAGSAVPPLAVGPPRTSSRGGARLKLAAVTVTLLALVVAAVAVTARDSGSDGEALPSTAGPSAVPSTTTAVALPPPQPGSFTDDFSGPTRRWIITRTTTGQVVQDYVDGAYRFAVFPPPEAVALGAVAYNANPSHAPITAAPSHSVRMEVDATKTSAERGDYGMVCGGPTSQFPYGALVDDGGWWRLVSIADRSRTTELRSGREPSAVTGPGPHRLVLECVGRGNEISMSLSVNGVLLATATAQRGTSFGPGPGLLVLPFRNGPVDVLFDNVALTWS